ncbi:hypothetical protein EDB84DRAFT_1561630 [Lactarius hengduanensis]|nr:hypothetical protein EDB84DRAFT_1561630 [Lactarius hengduanensis]
MGSYFPATENRNRHGVTGFIGEYPNPDDLKMFMSEFGPEGRNVTYEVVQIKDGGCDPSNPGLEANQNIHTSGTQHEDDHFINWTNYLLKQKNILQTVTASYYGVDKDDFPPGVANTICILFKQLGVRGVSALTDDGAGKGNYKDTSGNVHFRPFFPASCNLREAIFLYTSACTSSSPSHHALTDPWVTMVGGTTDYQDNHLGGRYSGFYNHLGRGIPDISAHALNFMIVCKGESTRFQGARLCVFPFPYLLSALSVLGRPADRRCTDYGQRYLTTE